MVGGYYGSDTMLEARPVKRHRHPGARAEGYAVPEAEVEELHRQGAEGVGSR